MKRGRLENAPSVICRVAGSRIGILFVSGLLIAVAIVVARLTATAPLSNVPRVIVRHIGSTNRPDGTLINVFQISNASPFVVCRLNEAILEFQSHPPQCRLYLPTFGVLQPGQCEQLDANVSTSNSIPWRLRVVCERPEEGLQHRVREMQRWLQNRGFERMRPGDRKMYVWSSDWIAP